MLLLMHGLVGVALFGANARHIVSDFKKATPRSGRFVDRYTGVNTKTFTTAVICLYLAQVALGAIIYPA